MPDSPQWFRLSPARSLEPNNLATVERVFEAVRARSVERWLDECCHDVVILDLSGLPHGGTYRGIDGVLAHARLYRQTWGAFQRGADRDPDEHLLAAGPAHGLAVWRLKARGGDGERLDHPALALLALRDGRVQTLHMLLNEVPRLNRFLAAQPA